MSTPYDVGPVPVDLSWQAFANCATADPEIFTPDKGGTTRPAKRICEQCSVRRQCLEYALDNDERFSIWGGLTRDERKTLLKLRAKSA